MERVQLMLRSAVPMLWPMERSTCHRLARAKELGAVAERPVVAPLDDGIVNVPASQARSK